MAIASSSIRPLPQESQAQIRSSVVITSLNEAIIGLLENALDAQSTSVEIHLDYSKGYCSITDNGFGIPAEEFDTNGHLGLLHHTSKLDASQSTYGRYGSFLYHIGSLSLLTITSKQGLHECSLTTHRTRVIARSSNEVGPAPTIDAAHGSKVVIHNLFGDIPVRYRYIAARMESSSAVATEFEKLKKITATILLAHDPDINIKIVEINSKQIYKHKAIGFDDNEGSDLKEEQPSSVSVEKICSTLCQAGFLERFAPPSWKVASIEAFGVRIRATISLLPAPSKDVQFISVGHRPMTNAHILKCFLSEINAIFENSMFGIAELNSDHSGNKQERLRFGRQFASDTTAVHQKRAQKKGVDRWPMFYVRIDLHNNPDPVLENSSCKMNFNEKLVEKIINLLRSLFNEFLHANNFQPHGRQQAKLDKVMLDTPATSQDAAQDIEVPVRSLPLRFGSEENTTREIFSSWPRTKANITTADPIQMHYKASEGGGRNGDEEISSHPQTPAERIKMAKKALIEAELQNPNDGELASLVKGLNESLDSHDADEDIREPGDSHAKIEVFDPGDAAYVWTDPATGIEYMINARNGLVLPQAHHFSLRDSISPSRSLNSVNHSATIDSIAQLVRQKAPKRTPAELISSLRQNNFIRTMRHVEPQIPSLVPDEVEPNATTSGSHRCGLDKTSSYFSKPAASVLRHSLRKYDLQTARVLSQVDRKFILVQTLPTDTSNSILVLIDQHAADERIKVEELYSQVCEGEVTELIKPIVFEVSAREMDLFRRYQASLALWQFTYAINETSKQVTVSTVPSLISERCRLDPKLLIDLLRREIHAPSTPTVTLSSVNFIASADWIHRIPHCPAGLLEMINSRACRSAIMFNDVLDQNQCKELVRKLARCTLPFICAHGRPSCVVLPGWMEAKLEEREGFTQKFKKWKCG